ncbi:hypothetical protein GUITHDRAFT_148934 [Guillardia theta CCMP2712]|uniref:Uncharacterized protein n=1 Tax=Guillardia theta (strain CCMP2712) TaxID=905079 RepID=L1I7W4_GUITC|nr:hypothetical protein GUITHDRAFT_148934 [Guillardia theta CCMP2712]EKX31994.1 hypothetical protein GUITHDRAFT_148934 [Guillardia theta CCMP2712]|eukprot:XP_005818974.1 hypothetical protein GUITHDRAFT_148934 [Guillardia theta CCMP2712]
MTSPITPLPVFLSYFGCNASPAVVSTPDNLVTGYNYLPSSARGLAHTVDGQAPHFPAACPSTSKPCHACDPALSPSQPRTSLRRDDAWKLSRPGQQRESGQTCGSQSIAMVWARARMRRDGGWEEVEVVIVVCYLLDGMRRG